MKTLADSHRDLLRHFGLLQKPLSVNGYRIYQEWMHGGELQLVVCTTVGSSANVLHITSS